MESIMARSVGLGTSSILPSLQTAKESATQKLCILREDCGTAMLHPARMKTAKNAGPNYLKAWREFRELTQEELAERAGTTGSVISLLEEGERGLSLKWLRRLAPALETQPGFLADYDPNKLDTRALEMMAHIPDDRKEQVLRIIETFLKEGTNG